LKQHVQSHKDKAEKKSYPCKIEGRQTVCSSPGNPNKHLAVHNPNQQCYPCDVEGCLGSFVEDHNLTKHLKNVHKIHKSKTTPVRAPQWTPPYQLPIEDKDSPSEDEVESPIEEEDRSNTDAVVSPSDGVGLYDAVEVVAAAELLMTMRNDNMPEHGVTQGSQTSP
jgi:hypothetical protein